MKHATEVMGLVFFILLCVWVALIYTAPPLEKPITMCRPVALPFDMASKAGGAFNPHMGQVIQSAGDRVAFGCLSYTARLVGLVPQPSQNKH